MDEMIDEVSFIRGDTFPFKTKLTYKDKTPVLKAEIDTLFVTCRITPNIGSTILFQKKIEDVEIDEAASIFHVQHQQ